MALILAKRGQTFNVREMIKEFLIAVAEENKRFVSEHHGLKLYKISQKIYHLNSVAKRNILNGFVWPSKIQRMCLLILCFLFDE